MLRRTDKRTGQIYHLKYSPPPAGADLEHRADDREEVVEKRLDTYEAMTAELLPYYEERGILTASGRSRHDVDEVYRSACLAGVSDGE